MFISCGGSNSGSTISQKKVRSGLDKYNNGYDLEKGEHGMMQSKSTKKSNLNNLRASVAGGTVNKTDYSKASYRKKRWGGGGSSYDKKSFNNTGGYNTAAYRASKNNNFDKGYSAGGSNFQGQSYTTSNNTQERNAGYVRTGNSAYVTSRKNATNPVIIDRDDYNQLRVSESNSLLGR